MNKTTISFEKVNEIATSIATDKTKIADNIINVVNTTNNLVSAQQYITDQASTEFMSQVSTFNSNFQPFLEDVDKYVQFLNTSVNDYLTTEKEIQNEANSIDSIMPIAGAAAVGGTGMTLSDINSIKDSTPDIPLNLGVGAGATLVANALKYVGNPYVWGGTSLTQGADCSGFIQTLCKQLFGIDLPHNAAAQSKYGAAVGSINEAQPGDLLFYKNSEGKIHHVTIYMGNGMEVEAKGKDYGIVSEAVSKTPAIIKRVC